MLAPLVVRAADRHRAVCARSGRLHRSTPDRLWIGTTALAAVIGSLTFRLGIVYGSVGTARATRSTGRPISGSNGRQLRRLDLTSRISQGSHRPGSAPKSPVRTKD